MTNHSGFILKDFAEFGRFTVFDLPQDVVLERQAYCPACDTELRGLLLLIGRRGKQQMQVGVCQHCGYVGFMDRPAKEWMVNFYASVWDTHIAKTVAQVQQEPQLVQEKKPSRKLAGQLGVQLPADKNQPVCEIGSGYGSVLKYFKDTGFGRVFGTENSHHRASVVSHAYSVRVIPGNFESPDVQKELIQHKPFGLIFSHHVLEHTYAPAEVILHASRLQDEGGYLVLALPNVVGEHAGYKTFYLPHLHGFTKESLELLLNRFGYEIVEDVSPDDSNMIIAAKKVSHPKPRFTLRTDYYEKMLVKFRKGLMLNQLGNGKLQKYFWQMDPSNFDRASVEPVSMARWYWGKLALWTKARFRRIVGSHLALVEPLVRRMGSAPIEIQYPGAIRLLMK